MVKSPLLFLSIACAALSGCDETKSIENKQKEIELRVRELEEQLTVAKSELDDLVKASKAKVTSFESCISENMRGVASDLAAKSIKVACLKESSIEISKAHWTERSADGGFAMLFIASAKYQITNDSKSTGFWITFKNNMEYIVTEITTKISVEDGPYQSYRTDDFYKDLPLDPRVIVTALPQDPTVAMRIDPFKEVTYFVKADVPQVAKDSSFKWDIVSMKGIPTK